jgi:hypothetical protein
MTEVFTFCAICPKVEQMMAEIAETQHGSHLALWSFFSGVAPNVASRSEGGISFAQSYYNYEKNSSFLTVL